MIDYFTRLQAGPLEMVFDKRLGSIRYVKWQGREILRGIYAVVRDGNWKTIPTALALLKCDRQERSFQVEFQCRCELGDIRYEWLGTITGTENGRVEYKFDGRALSDFQRNRIGFCVLHPIRESGEDLTFQARKENGHWDEGKFPAWDDISPHQPVVDITGLRWQPLPGASAQLEFSGDLFEMEDQRNWGDASYKTYCTPQSRPKPVAVHADDRVVQSVVLEFSPPASAPVPAAKHANARHPLALGFSLPEGLPLSAAVLAKLAEIRPHHLRVDIHPAEAGWETHFRQGAEAAEAIGAGLLPALYLTDNFAAELTAIREAGRGRKIVAWLVLKDRTARIPDDMADLAVTVLGDIAPVAAGTDTQFVEINRSRPQPQAKWMPAFSYHPQSHLNDEETMHENASGPVYQLATLARFSNHPAVLSPISLRARFASRVFTPLPVDPRQEGEFGEQWLDAVLTHLQRAENLHCVTAFPTHGPGGLLDENGSPRPAWTMLRDRMAAR